MPSLEIGCGWQRDARCDTFMDINPDIPGLDYVGDASEPLPWEDNHFSLILATDCLEHISYARTHSALIEWARVLAPGGKLYVQVPDTKQAISDFLADPRRTQVGHLSHEPPITSLAWRLLGGHFDGVYTVDPQRWRDNAHFALFDSDSLHWHLAMVGLVVDSMTTNAHPNLLCWSHKP